MPRSLKFVLLAATPLAAIALAVLYGIGHGRVHAPTLLASHAAGVPSSLIPASLAPFALAQKPALVPAASFLDGAGKRHDLSEFRGRYVLVNLWATWCAPCVKELPQIAELQQAVPSLGVVVVNWGEDGPAAADFLKAHNVASLGDNTDKPGNLAHALHAYGLPLTLLIDPHGNIVGQAEGPADWNAPASIAYFKALTAS